MEHPEALAIGGRSPLQQMIRAAKTSRAQLLALDQGQAVHDDAQPHFIPARLRTRLVTALTATADRAARATAPRINHSNNLTGIVGQQRSSTDEVLPSYLVDTLGLRPHQPDDFKAWQKGANAIERYRLRWGIDDATRPLGPLPGNPDQATDHRATTRILRGAQRRLGVGPGGQQLGLAI